MVISIIAVLAGLLLSVMSSSSQKSKTVKCFNFMRQIGAACLQYAGEHDGSLPVTSHQRSQGEQSWTISLQKYAGGTVTFRCPADEDKTRQYTYVVNDFMTPNPAGAANLDFSKLTRVETPRATILFAEAAKEYANSDHFHFTDYYGQAISPEVFKGQVAVQRHDGSANYLFVDGHVETLKWEDVQARLRETGSRFVDPSAEGGTSN